MATFLDLPEEIYILIANLLERKTLYSCIRVYRSFHSSFIPSLWKDLIIKHYTAEAIDAASIRDNAHWVEELYFPSSLTEEYYTIAYPRLHSIVLSNDNPAYEDPPTELLLQTAQFARLNPSVRKLTIIYGLKLSREFWEVVEAEWKNFKSLKLSGVVDTDAA
ncbi:hypothetical protein BGX23_011770, partial [Mortierella sp. AD031]